MLTFPKFGSSEEGTLVNLAICPVPTGKSLIFFLSSFGCSLLGSARFFLITSEYNEALGKDV